MSQGLPMFFGTLAGRRSDEYIKLTVFTTIGFMIGLLVGFCLSTDITAKVDLVTSCTGDRNSTIGFDITDPGLNSYETTNASSSGLDLDGTAYENNSRFNMDGTVQISNSSLNSGGTGKIWVAKNPRGAERLPPGIVEPESDLYLRRLWGNPSEDLPIKQKYLVVFTVGKDQKANIDAAVKKFSGNFTIMLFHYDGEVSDWDEYEWSKKAIHVSAIKQAKWWYAKRFLHPDIVAPYEYIFIWDEDLGLENFNAEEYIKLVKMHGLEISQPALAESNYLWPITRRREDHEVHRESDDKSCNGSQKPPCSGFVEIMAPVFSRDAWRCVWHMIQNDLVHGWGLDFALRKCVESLENIGVVDAQWVVHKGIPSLSNQGQWHNGKLQWQGVKQRCRNEMRMFQTRLEDAEKAYYKDMEITSPN